MKTHILVSILLIVAVLAAAGAIVAALAMLMSPAQHRPAGKIIPKVLAPPVRAQKDYTVRIVGYGSVRPAVRVEIAPEVGGRVVKRGENFFSGKYLARGEVLFEIEKTDYEQAKDAAEAKISLLDARLKRLGQEEANLAALAKIGRERVSLLKKTYERATALQQRGHGTTTEVDAAREGLLVRQEQLQNVLNQKALLGPQGEQLKAERRIAEVEEAQAQTALSRATVRSPVTGRVLSCGVETGKRVQAGTVVGELYGMEIMEVPVSIPASDLHWIDPVLLAECGRARGAATTGRRIAAEIAWAEPGTERTFTWEGWVDRVEAGLEAQTRTATLVVQVRNRQARAAAGGGNPTSAAGAAGRAGGIPLDINMFCKVIISGRKERRAFLLPRRAILPDNTVFLANDGVLAQRSVRVARHTDDTALILPGGGLKEGDRVVLSYVRRAVLGMRVEATDTPPGTTQPTTGAGP